MSCRSCATQWRVEYRTQTGCEECTKLAAREAAVKALGAMIASKQVWVGTFTAPNGEEFYQVGDECGWTLRDATLGYAAHLAGPDEPWAMDVRMQRAREAQFEDTGVF